MNIPLILYIGHGRNHVNADVLSRNPRFERVSILSEHVNQAGYLNCDFLPPRLVELWREEGELLTKFKNQEELKIEDPDKAEIMPEAIAGIYKRYNPPNRELNCNEKTLS